MRSAADSHRGPRRLINGASARRGCHSSAEGAHVSKFIGIRRSDDNGVDEGGNGVIILRGLRHVDSVAR